MTLGMVVVICVTVVILALIAAIVHIITFRVEEKQSNPSVREELRRMQKQCNDMYELYSELSRKIGEITQ